jgi:succinate dehydrogenase / fumarate reductase cytochrome b subunit
MVLMLGWSWALFYHLCNGIRHLIQDGGAGYQIPQIVRSSWLAAIGSVVLTVVVWIYVLSAGGGA